jgi:hypothetical protein
MKRVLAPVLAMVLGIGLATAASATLKVGSNHTFGPSSMSGPDNGTCGNVWANDSWNRYFVVENNPTVVSGHYTYDVTRWDRNGTFHTIAGTSPGACDTASDNGNTVAAGIRGHFHGFVNYVVTCPDQNTDCFDPAAAQQFMNTCSTNQSCTTDGFIAAAFGSGATYTVGTYKYVYTSRNSSLCESKWVDQTSGDSGDIASTCA